MNKRYIVFALALFACFGGFKNINAGEDGIYKLETNATTEDLIKLIKTEGNKIKLLDLCSCKGIDLKDPKINLLYTRIWLLDLNDTDITNKDLQKILESCPLLADLDLNKCKNLDEKYQKKYETQEAIEELKNNLKKDLTQKPSWLIEKWQTLSTPWKWTIVVSTVAIPLIGACIFYKRSQSIQNLSSAIWYRLAPLLKRQKTVNQPLIAQNRFKI